MPDVALPTSDSSDAVDTSLLVALFEGGASPSNSSPVMQRVIDLVQSVALLDSQIPASISRDAERTAAISAAVAALVDGAASNRDTLKELADAIAAVVPGISQAAADLRYLALAGGTLTGALTLSGAPSADLHAATKKYVDDNAGGSGPAPSGVLTARVERINFGNLASGNSDAELTPSAGSISVVNGSGSAEILSGISGNDFTCAPGVYLVNLHGNFTASSNVTVGLDIRRSSDDAELDQANAIFVRSTTDIYTTRILLILAAATEINLFATRSGNLSASALHAEFVRLSSGGQVHSAHNRYIGWAAQQAPDATEQAAAAEFTSDVLTIPAEDTDGWLWFAVPTDAGAPAAAYFDGNTHDILGGFTRLPDSTFAGHIVYGSNAEQDPAILGTGLRTLTLDYS